MRQYLYFIAFFFLLSTATASANMACGPKEKTFLWEIKHQQSTVHLLGSIHVFKKKWYPLNKAIENAFESADHLAVELDTTTLDQHKMLSMMVRLATLPTGQKLSDYLDKPTIERIKNILGSSMPFAFFQNRQPWLIEIMLSIAYVQQLGYSELDGIDLYFTQRAQQAQKTILELETIEIQLAALSGFPIPMQIKNLHNTLKHLENGKAFDQLLCAWWQGDAEKMFEIGFMQEDEDSPAVDIIIDRLVNQRNIQMVEKIKGYLQRQGHFFVVVGALHFGGEKGLIRLLDAAGFKARQVPYQK